MSPIRKFEVEALLSGRKRLPAGAVPLAEVLIAGVVCLMPSGRWIMWLDNCIHSRPGSIQKEVMEVLISQLGGTAAAMADALKVSPRTVEAWRSGKAPMPVKSGYAIAKLLAAKTNASQ